MNVRILPIEEWPRVAMDDPFATLPFVEPRNAALVVVEKGGEIVARLGAYAVTYLEGLWVAPACRGNAGIMRALLRQVVEIPRARGERWALGSADSNEMRGYLGRLGLRIPVDLYALWVGQEGGQEKCQQEQQVQP